VKHAMRGIVGELPEPDQLACRVVWQLLADNQLVAAYDCEVVLYTPRSEDEGEGEPAKDIVCAARIFLCAFHAKKN